MYGNQAHDLLKRFRLYFPNLSVEQTKILTDEYGISPDLLTKLWSTHDKCRQQLWRAELKIYYSLIPYMKRKVKEVMNEDRIPDEEIKTWSHTIAYIDRLELRLYIRSPRTERFRQELLEWEARAREKRRRASRKEKIQSAKRRALKWIEKEQARKARLRADT